MVPKFQIRSSIVAAVLASAALVHLAPEYLLRGSSVLTAIAIAVPLIAISLIYVVFIWPFFINPLRHLPQPKGGSLINGHAPAIIKEFTGLPHRYWIRDTPNDGLLYYRFFFNHPRIVPTSAKAMSEVLVNKNYDFEKPYEIRGALGNLTGVGLLLAEGDEHKLQRKNLMPAFQYRHVKDLYPVFWQKAIEMVQMVGDDIAAQVDSGRDDASKVADGYGDVNFSPWLNRCTLDIIGLAGMGYDFGSLADPNIPAIQAYQTFFRFSKQARVLMLMGFFLPHWFLSRIPVQRNRDIRWAVSTIRNVARKVLQEKRREMEKGDAEEKGAAPGKRERDIISVALASGGFTGENLVNQIMTFLVAGHETTSTITSWALYELAQRPDIQVRLRAEIHANLPSDLWSSGDGAGVSAELLDRLPYLHAVCNEVLRFRPPVSITRRECVRDTEIIGQFIPKGTGVVLAPTAINFSHELWGPDAWEFNPDRWMGEGRANTGGASSNFANMTFIHGPRSCIGQAFSKSEFHCLLAAIVGRFEFVLQSPDEKIEIQTGVVSRIKGGARLRMKPIDDW